MFCSYYRRFIPNFAEVAKPLHQLTEKGQKFLWTDECNTAFERLKNRMVNSPILAHPDFTKPFVLDTDASDLAIGAVLSQRIDGQEHVIAYASRTLTKSERRYCVTKKELLALVHFVKYFRHYLYGKKFTIRTDHGSLRWLMQFKNPEGQIARWLEILSSYEMKIGHRPGRLHRNADGLSRIPCNQCGIKMLEENNDSETVVNRLSIHSNDENVIDITSLQEENDDIKQVKEWIINGTRPAYTQIKEGSYFLKSIWSQWPRLQLKDDIVVRKWAVLGTDVVFWQAIVPFSHRRMVLKYAHDIKASGHLGVKKTLSKIRQRYYWPGLHNDVRTYVAGCEKCCKRKSPIPSKHAPMQVVRSGYPMERIAVDIAGEFPVTEKGNKYILVIQDYFSKWVECFAMPNMEASTVARIMVNEVVARFGIPNLIHSDQGRQFESALFKEMCKLLQIEKTRTTTYHPQSDGMVERFNRTLASMISMFVNENHSDWDELLPFLTMAYRATEHETTGISPNLLMLGRETTTPLDIAFEMPAAIKSIPANQWVWELQERLERAHKVVRDQTGKSINRQKRYHDRKLSFKALKPEDSVYVLFPVRKSGCSRKWTSFWRGPFKVSEKVSDVLFKINCGRFGSAEIIHLDRIRKASDQVLPGELIEHDMLDLETEAIPLEQDDLYDHESSLETEGRPRREIRKPAWLTDYICSLFRSDMAGQRKGPKIKVTPRKHSVPGFICDYCKVHLGTLMAYKKHVLECLESRFWCDTCGKTFGKIKYKKQHMSRCHADTVAMTVFQAKKPETKTDITPESLNYDSEKEDDNSENNKHDPKCESDKEYEKSDTGNDLKSDSEDSELGADPEILLCEEEKELKHDSEDKLVNLDTRKVNDIRTGRIYRKKCEPMPVIAPIKHMKLPEEDTDMKPDEMRSVKEDTDRKESDLRETKRSSTNIEKVKTDLEISFSVKGGDRTTQTLNVVKDGEQYFSSTSANFGPSFGDMKFNMEDFFGPGTANLRNISVEVQKEQLKIKLNKDD